MVTSPSPGDGRTVVATNLAACIAHGGRKVLLVDANFHQPTIDQLFPQAPQGGLSSALVGQADWTDLIHQVEENLYVLASGPLPPNPAELLGSEQMGTVISEMTAQYDQVLFDAAPMLVVTDPAVLSTLVDGVILVVRAGASTYGVVQRARDMLMRVGAHVIGAVLNGVRVTAGGYFRKSYDTFYEYRGEQAQLPEK
jgi:capsular exopolysaccharide synthesis family protein